MPTEEAHRPGGRIGVFGGTFDPPHLGHLIAAQEVHLRLRLDRLLFVPAAVPPHKEGRRITGPELRLDMLRATVSGDPRFEADDREIRRGGTSYTVDTLKDLSSAHPSADLFLIIGADQLRDFGSWHEPSEIRRLATLVAFERSGEWPHGATAARVPIPRLDISGTMIRDRVANGQPIRYLVTSEVESIIRRRGLYRPGWSSPGNGTDRGAPE